MFRVRTHETWAQVRYAPGLVEVRCEGCGRVLLDGSYCEPGEIADVLAIHVCQAQAAS